MSNKDNRHLGDAISSGEPAMPNAIEDGELASEACLPQAYEDDLLEYELASPLSYDYVTDNAHLVMAATHGDVDDVRKYLSKGADISAVNYGAFVGAAMNGNVAVLEFLLSETEGVPVSALKESWEFAKRSGETQAMSLLERSIAERSSGAPALRP